jgi:hypothetical protein
MLSSSSTTNSPSATELATAGWVRGLLQSANYLYLSANTNALAATNYPGGNFLFTNTLPGVFTRTYIDPSVGTYLGSTTITNLPSGSTFGGPVVVSPYMGFASGGGNALSVQAEIYYSYNQGVTMFGDWESPAQTITAGATNHYDFVITFPPVTFTNTATVFRVFKVVTKGGSPTLAIKGGTGFPSSISYNGPVVAGSGDAILAANQTWTGSNIFNGGLSGNAAGLTNLNATELRSGEVAKERLQFWPTLTHDTSAERGWVQQQSDSSFQVTFNGDSLTNLAAANVTGTLSQATYPVALTNKDSRAVSLTNTLTAQTLVTRFISSTNVSVEITTPHGVGVAASDAIHQVIFAATNGVVALDGKFIGNGSGLTNILGSGLQFLPAYAGSNNVFTGTNVFTSLSNYLGNLYITTLNVTTQLVDTFKSTTKSNNYVYFNTDGELVGTNVFFSPTNSVGTGAYSAGQSYHTNLTGDVVLAPFAGIPSSMSWAITIAATADGTNRKITFPNGSANNAVGTAPATAYVTNGTTLVLQVVGYGSTFTNVLTPH